LGDFSGKIGKEDILYTESTCENGKRLVSFAQIYDLIIMSTKFQHK